MQAARIAAGGENAHIVPRIYGRIGYDVPVAQSTSFKLKPYHATRADDEDSVVNVAHTYAETIGFSLMLILVVLWTTQVAALTIPVTAFLLVSLLVPPMPVPSPLRLPQSLPRRLSPLL